MNKVVKRIWNIVTNILVILVVLLALSFVGGRIFGMQTYIVLSGSMEPTYSTGSLLYVKDIDPSELSEGDVITYLLTDDTLVTHRIVELVPSEENPTVMQYRTKGDANESEDVNLVSADKIIGTPVFSIPHLGYLADYIMNPPGRYIAIAAAAFLILLVFLPDLFEEEEGKKKKKGKKSKAEIPKEVKRPKKRKVKKGNKVISSKTKIRSKSEEVKPRRKRSEAEIAEMRKKRSEVEGARPRKKRSEAEIAELRKKRREAKAAEMHENAEEPANLKEGKNE